ncbi:MAG: purine nucleoside permease [Elioraea tepidiphila]
MNPSAPFPVRVVVVTLFDPGDAPGPLRDGEFRRWTERLPLPDHVPFGFGPQPLRLDRERGILGIVAGVGNAAAAAAVAGLGADPRFDLSRAYWLMAGIAGADPEAMPIGSVAWIDHVVDGDLLHEIDLRDAPPGWRTGRLPLGRDAPFAMPPRQGLVVNAHPLNQGLVAWAQGLTAGLELVDSPEMAAYRARFAGTGAQPAGVLRGAVLASSNFWHGPALLDWAREWVAYWTEGRARFVASAMEDAGVAHALAALGRAGRADPARLLMLRSASNYVVPRPGLTAAESIGSHKQEGFVGLVPALENAYLAGRRVVDALLDGWDEFAERVPSAG